MFTMDVPYVPVQGTPIVLAQAATPSVSQQPGYLLNACTEFSSGGGGLVDPTAWLVVQIGNRSNRYILGDATALASVKLTMLVGTTHGELIQMSSVSGRIFFKYKAAPDYLGKDKAIFMAEFEGKRYKVVVNFVITEGIDENNPQCPAPQLIKVKKPSTGDSGFGAGYNLASVSVTFADLEGAAIGQTTGTTITLDTNAANYNWYIDPTPGQNEEYHPTSNPNEWVAKAGSAAYGKMDMLSVLLHEYGHALGINHSADPNDFMGTTLTAGVRRLPSAEEMALMQQLVGQVKAALAESTPSLTLPLQGGGNSTPGFPTLPLGTSFIGFLGLLRSSRYGGVNIVPDESTLTLPKNFSLL